MRNWGKFILGKPFLEDSFDYASILLHSPNHFVRKRKHLATPTHPPTHLFDYAINEWSLIQNSVKNLHFFLYPKVFVLASMLFSLQMQTWKLAPNFVLHTRNTLQNDQEESVYWFLTEFHTGVALKTQKMTVEQFGQ